MDAKALLDFSLMVLALYVGYTIRGVGERRRDFLRRSWASRLVESELRRRICLGQIRLPLYAAEYPDRVAILGADGVEALRCDLGEDAPAEDWREGMRFFSALARRMNTEEVPRV